MRKRFATLFVGVVLTLSLIVGCGNKSDSEGQIFPLPELEEKEEISQGLTSFETTDLYGEVITQEIFSRYDLTMVNVWGTFCNPCLEEMPYLGELQKEYEPAGVNIVGIVIDVQDNDLQVMEDQKILAQEIAETTGADYTHLLVSFDMIEPVLSQFDAIPATFFVDSDGNLVSEFYIGSREKDQWKQLIDETLENMK